MIPCYYFRNLVGNVRVFRILEAGRVRGSQPYFLGDYVPLFWINLALLFLGDEKSRRNQLKITLMCKGSLLVNSNRELVILKCF